MMFSDDQSSHSAEDNIGGVNIELTSQSKYVRVAALEEDDVDVESTQNVLHERNSSIDSIDSWTSNSSKNLLTGESLSKAEEYQDDPSDAKARPSVLLYTAGFIIICEFCERVAYYGFAGSLVLFFQTRMNMSNAEADVQYSAWSGLCYITPLLGGYIADVYLGRYWTILLFSVIYALGLILVVIGSIPGELNVPLFFFAIYIVALGTGGIKPNVSTMGADQFDMRYSQDRKEKESFFNWFYWAINLGALISYSIIAYICQYGIPALGGPSWGFFVGFLIPAITMLLAIIVFLGGTQRYVKQRAHGSVVAETMQIFWEAVTKHYTAPRITNRPPHFLDNASTTYNGSFLPSQVEAVKTVYRLGPFLLVMVPFWGVYSQMSTAFQNQACQLDLALDRDHGVYVPIAALNSFDTIAILLLVPVFDKVVYPYCKEKGFALSMLQKIGWGFVIALVSMLLACILEIARLQYAPAGGDFSDSVAIANASPCVNTEDYDPNRYQSFLANVDGVTEAPKHCYQHCDSSYNVGDVMYVNVSCISCENIPQMSELSVFWQIPQFVLIGVAEILASITSLEFFYSQAPLSMRSVTQSLNLGTSALGSFVVIPLVLLFNSRRGHEWVPENLDEGHLDYYFGVLALLMGLTLSYFYYISKDYVYLTAADLEALEQPHGHDDGEVIVGDGVGENPMVNRTGGYAQVSVDNKDL